MGAAQPDQPEGFDRNDIIFLVAMILIFAFAIYASEQLQCDYLTEPNNKQMNTPDFYFNNCGTIITLTPQTDKARQWIKQNLQLDSWQDPDQVPIEPRLFDDIHAGIINDSLTIEQL